MSVIASITWLMTTYRQVPRAAVQRLQWTHARAKCRAIVLTGTDTDFITVGVSLLDSEPELSLNDWEEAVDVSVHAPEGHMGVGVQ